MKYYFNDLTREITYGEYLSLKPKTIAKDYIICRNWTDDEFDKIYCDKVNELIRKEYSINDELKAQREREIKPEKFNEYNTFIETCKTEAQAFMEDFKAQHTIK